MDSADDKSFSVREHRGMDVDALTVDSAERIKGYSVLQCRQTPPTMDKGRFVLVDRGERYRNRYVVAYQPVYAEGWLQATYHQTLEEGLEVFFTRCVDADPVLRRTVYV